MWGAGTAGTRPMASVAPISTRGDEAMAKLTRRAVLRGSTTALGLAAMPVGGASAAGSDVVLLDLEAQWLAAKHASDEAHTRFMATNLNEAGEASDHHAAAMHGLEQRIKETSAATVVGLAVKLRVAATMVTDGGQKADEELESDQQMTVAALQDAERLARGEG